MSMAKLIDAVYADDVVDVAAELLASGPASIEREELTSILETTARIGRRMGEEQHRVVERLRTAGVEVGATTVPERAQRHGFTLKVADPVTAEAAADALADDGFVRWEQFRQGAHRSFHRHGSHLRVACTTDVTVVVTLAWAPPTTPSRWERLVRPTPGDWNMVALPTWAWRAYPLVRATRLVAERIGARRRHATTLGPFLATPASLLGPLLEIADPEPDDVVVDLGCGDGRLLVEAATAFGCRAVGVESSEDLVRRAETRATEAGVATRVEVVHGDGRDVDLSSASVVFAFLPADVLETLLPDMLAALPSGARLIAHEQNRLPSSLRPRPDGSRLVIASDALTVAHRWDA